MGIHQSTQLKIDEDLLEGTTSKERVFMEQIMEKALNEGFGAAVWFFERYHDQDGIELDAWQARRVLYGVKPQGIEDLRALTSTMSTSGIRPERDRVLLAQETIMWAATREPSHPANDWARLNAEIYPQVVAEAILDGIWATSWIQEGSTLNLTGVPRPLASFCNDVVIDILKKGWYDAVDRFHEQGGSAGKTQADLHQALRELPLLGVMCTYNQLVEATDMPVLAPEKVKTLTMAMELIPKFRHHIMGETQRTAFETALKKMALMNVVPQAVRDGIQKMPTTARKGPGM